jgi:hypothetical protein
MMRFTSALIAIAALLAAGTASAAGGVGGKGDTGGKGGNGPGGATQAGSGDVGATVDTSATQTRAGVNPDKITEAEQPKPWEVGATWETHRLIRQEDLNGAAVNKVFNVAFFSGKYDFTDKDRLSVGWGLYQYFLADEGETGFRGTDISVAYTRTIPLPEKYTLRVSPAATIPVSYASQLSSLITAPSLTVGLSKRFGDLSLDARLVGGVFFFKYREAGSDNTPNGAGGVTNPKWRAGGVISAEYSMPFHRPLSLGVALTDSYVWFYDVGNNKNGSSVAQQQGAVQDSQFANQPMLQSYGGEIFVRYVMPTVAGFKSDLTVAVANGDPSLGYTGVLHDGVVHPYLFYRQTAEVYGALAVRY